MSVRHPHHNGPPPPSSAPPTHNGPAVSPTAPTNGAQPQHSAIHKLTTANEQTWLLIGRVAEQMGDLDHALSAYENALRHNPLSLAGLTQVAGIARIKENYPKAVEFFQRVLQLQEDNGEIWSALGKSEAIVTSCKTTFRKRTRPTNRPFICFRIQRRIPSSGTASAYSTTATGRWTTPKKPSPPFSAWTKVGIYATRIWDIHMDSLEDLDFDKANEILFRLGIIYKQQGKFEDSLSCFDRILRNPPNPLAHADIWFQIGHVYEQQKDYVSAKDAYERVVTDNPGHAKVLQQLGWLYHQDGSSFQNQDLAIQYLTKSLEADPSDAQSWYLLGRAYMAGQKYNKAYEAYQQAVYRDGRNPTFWCSIGVLYFQINQYRDALDAYSRAIRINPYISEVWFDLGSLYESCNNQISDAMDAYARASELDPSNPVISQRLGLLRNAQQTGGALPAAPGPQDVHPTAYASAVVPPPGLSGGPPLLLQSGDRNGQRPVFRADSRGPPAEISLPPPSQVAGAGAGRGSPSAAGPFRGGPPPPVILDESRHPQSHTPLAPMEVDRPVHGHGRERERERDRERGPGNLLLHHPVPQTQASLPPEEAPRNGHAHGNGHHHAESYFTRQRPHSTSMSPPPPRGRSPPPPPQAFVNSYPTGGRSAHQEMAWEREREREHERERERERERRPRHSASGDYAHGGGPPPPPHGPGGAAPPYPGYPSSPGMPHLRERGREMPPADNTSPRSAHPPSSARYWETPKPPGSSSSSGPGSAQLPPMQEHAGPGRRYDPRYDAREHHRDSYEDRERERERERERSHSRGGNYPPSHAGSPEGLRHPARPPPPAHVLAPGSARSESPMPLSGPGSSDAKRRRAAAAVVPLPTPKEEPLSAGLAPEPAGKKEKKRRGGRRKEDGADTPTPKLFGGPGVPPGGPYQKVSPGYKGAGPGSPGPVSSNGSGSSSGRSPTSAAPRMPTRVVDDDYDEPGVADALMGLSAYREMPAPPSSAEANNSHSPTVSAGSRHSDRDRERPRASHRDSISSTRSRNSPSSAGGQSQSQNLKRPLSPGEEMGDSKRTRVDVLNRDSGGRRTPIPSTRPSPIPFRTQPAAHDPTDAREPYPASPPLPAVFPPHPRPVGMAAGPGSGPIALPPIATLSPAPSPPPREREEEKMQVDSRDARSNHSGSSPPARRKSPQSPQSEAAA
ncbi:TPR-REGION domain-containing protein [Mycena kentingensis (nom. inval.)]|nr:TPR-REGION domain-containing protein [Mycena kentingensis (nom. inval.)]